MAGFAGHFGVAAFQLVVGLPRVVEGPQAPVALVVAGLAARAEGEHAAAAAELGITASAGRSSLMGARRKLGARNTTHAIVLLGELDTLPIVE